VCGGSNSEAEGRGWLEVLYKDSSVSVYMGVHNVFHFFHFSFGAVAGGYYLAPV
jgi:hypothetical protein